MASACCGPDISKNKFPSSFTLAPPLTPIRAIQKSNIPSFIITNMELNYTMALTLNKIR